ncbi:helix-turn-helix transcriptional regulator [Paucibacter sp. B51]|uniref:helix-turn-helix transcriptional regulator n=1 Tax=Paucibacter sp. B51 TaxID=2993315 RepID=UPI0022EBFF70|nr:LuxR family transcriptional regulator [Paucibacter sp. B51]
MRSKPSSAELAPLTIDAAGAAPLPERQPPSPALEGLRVDLGLWAAQLVDRVGAEDFFAWIAAQLQDIVAHEFCVILLHRRQGAPVLLHDGLTPLGFGLGMRNYLDDTYRHNPFHRFVQGQPTPGLFPMQSLVTQQAAELQALAGKLRPDEREEIGFITEGWPRGMQELLLAAPVAEGEVVEVSLSRKLGEAGVQAEVQARFHGLVPLLVSSIRKHFQVLAAAAPGRVAPTELGELSELSRREQDIVRLIVAGHSSESIGLRLGIALPTVKTHRANIYRKLGISSQAELFARVMRYFAA